MVSRWNNSVFRAVNIFCLTVCICPDPQKAQHRGWTLTWSVNFGWQRCVSAGFLSRNKSTTLVGGHGQRARLCTREGRRYVGNFCAFRSVLLWTYIKLLLKNLFPNLVYNIFYLFFKDFIYLFLERGNGRERNIDVWLPLTWPPLGTWPATQACAVTGNQTGNPLVPSPRSIHWATPARAFF